jgi:hypothetical protein
MSLKRRWCQAAAFVILGVSAACLSGCDGSDTSKVMGNIEVASGEHTGAVSTVNGSIRIRENASAGSANTVNGSISLERGASAAELETVNGSIELAQQGRVSGKVQSVNGRLSLADGADVGAALVNVNGTIRVAAAHVGGGIETATGDIELGPNARVEDGIHMHKQSGSFNLGFEHIPRIVIGPGSVVSGTLNFERPVKLYVSDKATIGSVQGATVVRYSGERLPD